MSPVWRNALAASGAGFGNTESASARGAPGRLHGQHRPGFWEGKVHVAVIPQTLDNLFLRDGVISTEKPCSVSMLAAGGLLLNLSYKAWALHGLGGQYRHIICPAQFSSDRIV